MPLALRYRLVIVQIIVLDASEIFKEPFSDHFDLFFFSLATISLIHFLRLVERYRLISRGAIPSHLPRDVPMPVLR